MDQETARFAPESIAGVPRTSTDTYTRERYCVSLASLVLAAKVKHHRHLVAVMLPGPAFRDVVSILKANDQSMLVANRRIAQVPGGNELKIELIHVSRGYSPHPRLVVGRTVVRQLDAIAIHAVEREHLLHVRGRQSFDKRSS